MRISIQTPQKIMIRTTSTISLLLLALATLSGYACAQEVEKDAPPKVEMQTLKVLVRDQDRHPLDGATVIPLGLRTKPQNLCPWNTMQYGPVPEVLTGEDGIAKVPYPKYIRDKIETGLLNLKVTRPNFVARATDISVHATEPKLQLERGYRIALTAIDAQSQERIKTNLYAVTSFQTKGKWQLAKNGMLASPTLARVPCIVRLVHFTDGQPTLFSKWIEIKPDQRDRILKKDVKLSLGVRVEGKLDDAVPRPIRNGYVSAFCARKAVPGGCWNRWQWSEQAEIKQDGTFVFESLPNDEVMQLIGLCDGWVPGKAKLDDVKKHFPNKARRVDEDNDSVTLPQLLKTEADRSDVVLPMLPAKDIKVIVLDPEGKPLPNATVGCYPNQYYFGGISTSLGAGSSTRDTIVEQKTWTGKLKGNPYEAVTDNSGTGFVKSLPDTRSARLLYVHHDDYELPAGSYSQRATFEFAESGVTEVTLKLQKKGTSALNSSQAEKK